MKIKSLIKDLDVVVKGSRELEITGICSDSRIVAPGNLFIAKPKATAFIPQAVNAGASAIVHDLFDPFLGKTQIIHPDVASIEAKLAARYYNSKGLFVVGVTGTKGKTTTTYLIKHVLEGLGKPSGLIGTVEMIVGQRKVPSTHTTHDVVFNHKALKEMQLQGSKAAVLEVSSHGLDQGRVEEIPFDLAVFTNLYPDHLDYHRDMQTYAAAKRSLFAKAKNAILNADSPWAEFMGKGVTYGIEKGDIRAKEISFDRDQTKFVVDGCLFTVPLIGRFNVYNALAAIAVGLHLGAKLEGIRDSLELFCAVPARLERIGNVFVDFAHTGEALENVLQTLREIAKGRVIVVFGCGGERDPGRRRAMAKAADKWADLAIVTNDNPRSEDPCKIAGEIVAGFQKAPLVELDRKKAIEKAIEMAKGEDLVLIAGKGHERVQILAHETIPFDDIEVVKEILCL